MELVNEAEPFVAQPAPFGVAQPRDLASFDQHRATIRRVEPTEHVQQRALAGARCTDDRDDLGRGDVEISATQHVYGEATFAIRLAPSRADAPHR